MLGPAWDLAGAALARRGITADQVTWLGAGLVLSHSVAYAVHGRDVVFAVGLAAFELLDDLDGAVARASGAPSHYGAWLDAMLDRVKDAAVLLAVAHVHGLWPACAVLALGAQLTSYAKARAGMEVAVDNRAWPDLFERFERVTGLVVVLVLGAVLGSARPAGVSVQALGLWTLAALQAATLVQRGLRARGVLREADRARRSQS